MSTATSTAGSWSAGWTIVPYNMGKHANGKVLGMLEPFLLDYSVVAAFLALEETPGQNLIVIIVTVQLMKEFAGFSQMLQGVSYHCH